MEPGRLRLDPWPGDYESAFQIEEFEEAPAEEIDISVESAQWTAVKSHAEPRPERLYFVDGVRRIEARVLADDESGLQIHGLFASIAAGSVLACRQKATFEDIRIRRYLILGCGQSTEAVSATIGNAELLFEPYSVLDPGPTGPILGMQQLMRMEEASIAEARSQDCACVFADGPLTYLTTVTERTVGIIKRLFKPYVSAESFLLVRSLTLGERTPLFAIFDGKHDRYSWYLRIANRRSMDHDIAGVLRLEVRAGVGVKTAVELASLSANCLPAFAADSMRDPRAPQNLLPVSALEHELKHRLGDPFAIRRGIEQLLAYVVSTDRS